ncbi:MetQ/NlpA family ABC transporter substrate-binding protein [Corynebacterium sp.]|uniref:MetQ/NlpA family ABC transporter substrate-binding protein n=1 Tax=Corynebacterium sp. TaxID=1720 RepID=UPI0025BA4A79|nr:MetQ/NlpA family ABC transporter substrate-binding protein [Corynebacterium sp.]
MITRLKKAAVVGAVAALSATGLTACMSDGNDGDGDTIVIGSTEANESQWQVFKEKAEEEGVDVEIKNITDYNRQNPSLSDGELDVNQFQHILYLAEYNVQADDDLVPFGSSQTFPMGLYAKDADTVEEIAEAGEVVIPNDTTNQGRAIKVLAAAGLVTLRDDNLLTPGPSDIVADKSDVTVTPVEAVQTAVAYNDGTPSVINNNYLANADVSAEDAVFKDDPSDPAAQPYVNVWVTTKENKDNEDYQKLVEIWHSDEVQKAVADDTNGSAVKAEFTPEELEKILADTEDKLREQGGAEDSDE